MAVLVEKMRLGDFVKAERPNRMSRALRTVLSGQVLKAGQVCTTDTAGKRKAITAKGNEAHRYTFTGTGTGGTFTLTLFHKDGYWVETAPIAWNAGTATVDAAIEAVLGTSSVTATVVAGGGGNITQVNITFGGTGYASTVQPLGSCDISNLSGVTAVAATRQTAGGYTNETQRVTIAGTITAGTFKLGITRLDGSMVWTDTIAYDATWGTVITNIQAALDNALGTNIVVATTVAGDTYATGFDLAFSGTGYAGLPFALVALDTAALTGATTSAVTRLSQWPDSICLQAADATSGDLANVVFLEKEAVVDADTVIWGGCDPTFGALCLAKVDIYARSEPAVQERAT